MTLELNKMSGEQAKKVLQALLNQLSGIDVTDMTTFELNLIRRCAKDKPKNMPQFGIVTPASVMPRNFW